MIAWGSGGSSNLGQVLDSDIRVERSRNKSGKWSFILTDIEETFLYCDSRKFANISEMEVGVNEVISRRFELGRK